MTPCQRCHLQYPHQYSVPMARLDRIRPVQVPCSSYSAAWMWGMGCACWYGKRIQAMEIKCLRRQLQISNMEWKTNDLQHNHKPHGPPGTFSWTGEAAQAGMPMWPSRELFLRPFFRYLLEGGKHQQQDGQRKKWLANMKECLIIPCRICSPLLRTSLSGKLCQMLYLYSCFPQ